MLKSVKHGHSGSADCNNAVICFNLPPLVTPLAYGLAILMDLLLSLHGFALLPLGFISSSSI